MPKKSTNDDSLLAYLKLGIPTTKLPPVTKKNNAKEKKIKNNAVKNIKLYICYEVIATKETKHT